MKTGDALLDLARANGRTSLFVVGTGKNAGKTVAMRAIATAAARRGISLGLTSAGRDGETFDAVDAAAKPRLFLDAGTIVATAPMLLPAHSDFDVLEETNWQTAAGAVVFARVRRPAFYELAGPPKASELRRCVERLRELGCEQVIVDGAIDRVAALAGGDDAVVIAVGADAGTSIEEAAAYARALVERLCIQSYDPQQPFVKIEGGLTSASARRLLELGEKRQVVVRDPTQVVIHGKEFLRFVERVALRCERPLHVVAVTVAPMGRERDFDAEAFRTAVARETGLPVFDVYADAVSGAEASKE
ncbi:MAG TPA: hypothetical protein VFO29_01980 [Candidatus Rubrimentiphilum sp.]|nr:hypothetical protein [Candidatus Rubrimentiphilum sp.]